MTHPTLTELLGGLHRKIQTDLEIARASYNHGPTKGDASESVWLGLLNKYLPTRYQAGRAHIIDSTGAMSQQIDVVIYDRHFTPPIFSFEGQIILPAESVYAVFEAKQTLNAEHLRAAQEKARSVRCLTRLSAPVHSMGQTLKGREPPPLIAGILALESSWSPPLGEPLKAALEGADGEALLDLGCAATHGYFRKQEDGFELIPGGKPATAFLLELIARLQTCGTVPAIDIRAYAKWLD